MRLSFLSILFIVIFATTANAANFRLRSGQEITVDSVTASDTAFFVALNERSYCCQITSPNRNISFDSISASVGVLNNLADRGRINPWNHGTINSRRCFYFTDSVGTGADIINLGIDVSVSSDNVSMGCTDTTLYGGFNTSVTDFNFIEVTNTLTPGVASGDNGDVVVTIKASGTAGTELISTSFTLAAGRRRDVNVHESAPSDFGPVIITHNGPPGAIRAVNAQYRIVTAVPLDFEPVLVVPFREGRQWSH